MFTGGPARTLNLEPQTQRPTSQHRNPDNDADHGHGELITAEMALTTLKSWTTCPAQDASPLRRLTLI